jgi:hypothetical protein
VHPWCYEVCCNWFAQGRPICAYDSSGCGPFWAYACDGLCLIDCGPAGPCG